MQQSNNKENNSRKIGVTLWLDAEPARIPPARLRADWFTRCRPSRPAACSNALIGCLFLRTGLSCRMQEAPGKREWISFLAGLAH